jgi:hypothetical protein
MARSPASALPARPSVVHRCTPSRRCGNCGRTGSRRPGGRRTPRGVRTLVDRRGHAGCRRPGSRRCCPPSHPGRWAQASFLNAGAWLSFWLGRPLNGLGVQVTDITGDGVKDILVLNYWGGSGGCGAYTLFGGSRFKVLWKRGTWCTDDQIARFVVPRSSLGRRCFPRRRQQPEAASTAATPHGDGLSGAGGLAVSPAPVRRSGLRLHFAGASDYCQAPTRAADV